jgi:hypothetical protein
MSFVSNNLLAVLYVCLALVACKSAKKPSGQVKIPDAGIYPESTFFREFDFAPITVHPGTSEISVPWGRVTAGRSSEGAISPLFHYPEREYSYIFSHVGEGSIPKLEEFWTMILSSFEGASTPEIDWERHEETPYFAYGTYPAAKGMLGRIWIALAPSPSGHEIHLHLRMIEQPDNL